MKSLSLLNTWLFPREIGNAIKLYSAGEGEDLRGLDCLCSRLGIYLPVPSPVFGNNRYVKYEIVKSLMLSANVGAQDLVPLELN